MNQTYDSENSHPRPHSRELIAHTQLIDYHLRLRRPWVFARGRYRIRHGWLVYLEAKDGLLGIGDCAPLPEIGTENRATAQHELQRGANDCIGLDPYAALRQLPNAAKTPAARCGLETALVDLLAKRAGISAARWLNPHAINSVKINAMLGELDPGVEARAQQAIADGFDVLKIKLGVNSLTEEQSRLIALTTTLPTEVRLRLDVNGGWSETQLHKILPSLVKLPVESLEEPLADPTPDALRRLQAMVPWSIALDESVPLCQFNKLWDDPPVRRIVLKPLRVGGILSGYRIAKRCQTLGLESVITTTVDSAVGVWSALQLAAALGNNHIAQGLDTGSWLLDNIKENPITQAGYMWLGNKVGLGFSS